MADNNKNPRRTIWLSETEPLSHYDIWLSKNQHLNSDGEPLSDSGVQRDCDYIFKVWDCGDWHPIVGLNSTAVNKINTIKNQGYNSINPNTGHTISSYSYDEFHLPLFTKTECSPSELFDAGTIGQAILEYVTQEEWQDIFEGDAFSLAFKWYIEEGDTNLDLLVNPAEAAKLGGIWADVFTIDDMFPDSQIGNSHSQQAIINSYSWLAQAKYKYNHGTSDYNLYVNAKDIIKIVTEYQEDNPDEPGITPGGGAIINPEVLYNSFYDSESIKRDWNDDQQQDADKPRFSLWGAYGTSLMDNAGKYLKIRNDAAEWRVNPGPYSNTNNALEWQSAHDIVIEGTNYTGNTKKYLSCLDGVFSWETNVGTEYYANYPININPQTNIISILPQQGDTGELYLCSKNNTVSWQPIDAGTTYIQGVGISINNINNSINIDTSSATTEGQVLSYDGNGDIEWITIQSGQIYTEGAGIDINSNNKISCNIEDAQNSQLPQGSNISLDVSWTAQRDSLTVSDQNDFSQDIYIYEVCDLSSIQCDYTFNLITSGVQFNNNNPIYLKIQAKNITLQEDTNYICSEQTLSSGIYLVTIQFGIIKFEKINTYTSTP